MTDTKELIERLREPKGPGEPLALLHEAADALERLSREVDAGTVAFNEVSMREADEVAKVNELVSALSVERERWEKAEQLLITLLGCPALADEDHGSDPEWGDGETAEAIRAARDHLASPDSGGEAERQYYYRVPGCKATSARDPDCICWHDEGTGPLADGRHKPREWRTKPTPPASTPAVTDEMVEAAAREFVNRMAKDSRTPEKYIDNDNALRATRKHMWFALTAALARKEAGNG